MRWCLLLLLAAGCSADGDTWKRSLAGGLRGLSGQQSAPPAQEPYRSPPSQPIASPNPSCPIDNGAMYFTGRTQFEMGKMLEEYRCPMGHTNWIVK